MVTQAKCLVDGSPKAEIVPKSPPAPATGPIDPVTGEPNFDLAKVAFERFSCHDPVWSAQLAGTRSACSRTPTKSTGCGHSCTRTSTGPRI
ncbi:hypothetical protein EV648_110317 [Kribbella sp. VKM Ac-2568]|nr:hypothetical protein EV648_110317 [Kribbella sp. VKM Ac-2568]